MPKATKRPEGGRAKGDVIDALNSNPSRENWKAAQKRIQKEGKYYYVFYPTALKGKQSLFDAHIVIYDKAYRQLYKVPVMQKEGGKVDGSTYYLKGLEINRRMIA